MEDKKGETVVCDPNGTRCNICGATVPDGDVGCPNGHLVGEEYPVPEK